MLSTPVQLTLFPTELNRANAPALLLLACSRTKHDRPAPAIELYRGVMDESYRAHVRGDAAPNVLMLSVRHGFISPDTEIAPYDERMTPARADQMLADLPAYLRTTAWPARVGKVMLADGKEYRRVMRAALARQYHAELPAMQETTGGIGMQRSQLGAFLASLAPEFSDQIGQHANGTPLYLRYGWIEAGAMASLRYRATPDRPALTARVLAIIEGPNGPTADVE
ncbi:DUF6884 domain-containing protein, partial [Cupriavidus pinatubonensis]|uniref:DUF6884 domain-containing protein n=1 Tax=Cupriavidus pinatubonensis TaxID=248026 RepID=UPI0011298D11